MCFINVNKFVIFDTLIFFLKVEKSFCEYIIINKRVINLIIYHNIREIY
jgi:hypothetical protein